jgi:hypothetical protein
MKHLFTLVLLWTLVVLSARGQSEIPPAPQNTVLPPAPDSTNLIQPTRDSLQILPLREDLMAQIARDQQLTQEKLLAKLDQRNGFRDVTFGTHLKFFKKVVQEWKEGDDRNYRRRTDQMAINGMPLSEIVYGFHKERLQHIYLTAPGIENSRQMLLFFQSIYGFGERVYEETVEFDNMIQWTGKKVILTYSEVASKKEGFFHFFVVDGDLPANAPKGPGKKGVVPKPMPKKVLSSNKPLHKKEAL